MAIKGRIKKRVLIFLLVPILVAVPFFTDDLILRIIAAALTVLYVGIIIFLRDSMSTAEMYEHLSEQSGEDYDMPPRQEDDAKREFGDEPDDGSPRFDDGEEFTIVSPNKKIEVISAENYTPTPASTGQKSFFKPSDLKENFDRIANEAFPADVSNDEQFSFVLERVLTVVKEVFLAHTAVFFWFNAKKNRLTLEKFISSSEEIVKQKFDIEDDVLSKVVQNEEPEILSDINVSAESDVIRYYTKPQGIKSFVGVPLFYGRQLAGVLALDSKVSDAFGIETIYSLGKVVRVISIIVSLFDERYEETISEQRLQALLGILSTDKKFTTENELHGTIENAVRDLIAWDAFAFVYYSQQQQTFKTSKIINGTSLKYVGENLEVELDNTLVGKAVINGTPVKIDDTSADDYKRFSKSEDVSFDGSFLAIPLIYGEQNYGVLCFESLKKNVYTNADVHFLKNATKIFAFIVYSYSTQNLLRSLLSLDVETKTLNKNSFLERLESDLIKANEVEIPGALALVKIDEFLEEDSLFEGDPFPKVLKSVSGMIMNELTPLATMGRIQEKMFGVYFFNSTAKDVFLWAEKLRIKIARKPIAVVSKQTTFTVSIGVAAANNKTDVNEVYHNAELALNKALEKGGNTVKSIN